MFTMFVNIWGTVLLVISIGIIFCVLFIYLYYKTQKEYYISLQEFYNTKTFILQSFNKFLEREWLNFYDSNLLVYTTSKQIPTEEELHTFKINFFKRIKNNIPPDLYQHVLTFHCSKKDTYFYLILSRYFDDMLSQIYVSKVAESSIKKLNNENKSEVNN